MNDDSTPYVISNEHHLKILMEYSPRELDSIIRLTSKSFNRILIDINNTSNIKHKFITGNRLVEYLIANGMISLFDFVKESGCKFNPDELCYIATRYGQIDCLIHLRFKGYPCDEYTMECAAKGGHLQMMIYLHEEIGCDWPDDICFYSAMGGNVECLIYGHQHGCKRGDIATCVNNYSCNGNYLLFAAARGGHLQMVRELLDRGADVNSTNNGDMDSFSMECTSVVVASQYGRVEVVRELLNRGAGLTDTSISGWTLLMHASRGGSVEVVRELLNRGIDINAANHRGWNSLMVASQWGCIEVVRELLNRGADVNWQSNNRETATSVARTTEIARLLQQQRGGR